MLDAIDSGRTCPVCGCAIEVTAIVCTACGAELRAETDNPGAAPADDDPALRTVDPEHRVEVAHFEIDHGEEAEIACGLLRANGIACEVSSPMLPGLPAEQRLWVNTADAPLARNLLAEVRDKQAESDDDTDAA
jgi:hypothetical protein